MECVILARYPNVSKVCAMDGFCELLPDCFECDTDLCNGDDGNITSSEVRDEFENSLIESAIVDSASSSNAGMIDSVPFMVVWLLVDGKLLI